MALKFLGLKRGNAYCEKNWNPQLLSTNKILF